MSKMFIQMQNKKNIILYSFGITIFIIGIIFKMIYLFSYENDILNIFCYLFLFSGVIFIISVWIFDFKKVMIDSETAGDRYTLMSKEKIISELKKRNIEFKENRSKEYYLNLIREEDLKIKEKNNENK